MVNSGNLSETPVTFQLLGRKLECLAALCRALLHPVGWWTFVARCKCKISRFVHGRPHFTFGVSVVILLLFAECQSRSLRVTEKKCYFRSVFFTQGMSPLQAVPCRERCSIFIPKNAALRIIIAAYCDTP